MIFNDSLLFQRLHHCHVHVLIMAMVHGYIIYSMTQITFLDKIAQKLHEIYLIQPNSSIFHVHVHCNYEYHLRAAYTKTIPILKYIPQ